MNLCYADPPYPGRAHLYADHPDYAGECICAGRIVISHPAALRFYHSKAGSFAWHVPCEQEHGWPVLRKAVDAA